MVSGHVPVVPYRGKYVSVYNCNCLRIILSINIIHDFILSNATTYFKLYILVKAKKKSYIL